MRRHRTWRELNEGTYGRLRLPALMLLTLSVLSASGCQTLKLAAERVRSETRYAHTNHAIEERVEEWAEACWAASCPPIEPNDAWPHMHDGFVAGFKQFTLSANPQPPILPPEEYQTVHFVSPAGQHYTKLWFDWFRNGVIAAESGGYRDLVVLRPSLPTLPGPAQPLAPPPAVTPPAASDAPALPLPAPPAEEPETVKPRAFPESEDKPYSPEPNEEPAAELEISLTSGEVDESADRDGRDASRSIFDPHPVPIEGANYPPEVWLSIQEQLESGHWKDAVE